MSACANIGATAKLIGVLPVYVGMEVVLTESYLPPRVVRGTPVEVVDIELHPQAPSCGQQAVHSPALLRGLEIHASRHPRPGDKLEQ